MQTFSSYQKTMLLFAACIVAYGLMLTFHPLLHDAAYYWVWTKHLQLSYYDHAPMVAYGMKLTTLFGVSAFSIRLFSLICYAGTAWCIYHLALRMFSKQGLATKALFIFLLMPLTQLIVMYSTPNAPQSLFWTLLLYCAYRGIFESDDTWLLLSGVAGAGLLLSKYTGLLIFPAVGLFLLTTTMRTLFQRPITWLAFCISLLGLVPVVIWNAQNDWASLIYQYHHGMAAGQALSLYHFRHFITNLLLNFNPIFSVILLLGLCKNWRLIRQDLKLQFLLWPFLFTLAFFSIESISERWAQPALISASILVAYFIDHWNLKKCFRWGVFINLIWFAAKTGGSAIPGTPQNLHAHWGARISDFVEKLEANPKIRREIARSSFVFSDTYVNASKLEFELPGHPDIFVFSNRFPSQYNDWSKGQLAAIQSGKIVSAIYIGEQVNFSETKKVFKTCQVKKSWTQLNPRDLPKPYYKGRQNERTYLYALCKDPVQ